MAVIGIQMPPPTKTLYKGQWKTLHRNLGYGAGQSAKRASLYIALWQTGADTGICKFVYVKNPAMKLINPNNMMFSYRVTNEGTDFSDIQTATEREETQW